MEAKGRTPPGESGSGSPSVLILGAGVSGLCTGIQLRKAGIHSFTILEKSGKVGGTWFENVYPGAACDVPSHFYCYSFEPNPDWSHKFSGQAEIREYLERTAQKYGIVPHIRFGTEVAAASFDERAGKWRVRTTGGEELLADVLVSGCGQLNRPRVPDLPGLGEFEGKSFHSARWDETYDMTGKNVVVVGNGASAIQFIPKLAAVAKHVTILQRSPNWVVPRGDYAYSERAKRFFRVFPALARLYRWFFYWQLEKNYMAFGSEGYWAGWFHKGALAYLEASISDPELRRKLTPDYRVGCKRILIDDDFYPSLTRPNVSVVTSPIERIERDAVRTADGARHPADALVLATGFQATSFLAPIQIEGLGGKKLEEVWRGGAEAHLGLTVAGFPNFFMMYGPNTNLGHNSIIFMIECQVSYTVKCIQELARRGLAYMDVKPQVMQAFNEELQRDLEKSAWAAGCKSWYKTASGKVTNNWSDFTVAYWWRTRRPDFAKFNLVPRRS
ncbi:MAG TPA: NAD(P)/FAD-dependent oxidoreductase [Myxococcota bacterium]|nr:NAD(P)/FAD-dependent oxidoreductase [Myxococcota bacterium]